MKTEGKRLPKYLILLISFSITMSVSFIGTKLDDNYSTINGSCVDFRDPECGDV